MECMGEEPGFDITNINLTMVYEALIGNWVIIKK
jgi:hypothetical protein